MRVNKVIRYSILFSIVIHVLFLIFTLRYRFPEFHPRKGKDHKFFDVKRIDREKPLFKKEVDRPNHLSEESVKFKPPFSSDKAKADMGKEDIHEKGVFVPPQKNLDKPVMTALGEKLVQIIENKKSPQMFDGGLRRETRKDLVEKERFVADDSVVKPHQVLGKSEASIDFYDKMPAYTPKFSNSLKETKVTDQGVFSFLKGPSSILKRKITPDDLKDYIESELSVYDDPSEGQKYFKLSFRASKASSVLVSLPKEIIFLIDCSISIEEKRLEELKKGLSYCLTHLNHEDKFNIMAFKEETKMFSQISLKPDEINIKKALLFVDRLTAGEKTDTYTALYNSINLENTLTPSYTIFLSDGRPTKGITDPRKLITEISKLNNGKIAIFAFSGGYGFNRYLLDFISYKNRGWAEYSYRTHLIGKLFSEMYDKIRNPIMLNLRYFVSGLNTQEIFPKMLPDFFRNAEFTFYGKYSDENEFILQLLGDIGGKEYEFFINGILKDAKQGDYEIARNWAFNKIYHLISLLEYGQENKIITKEINYLCNKFKITTPYSNIHE